MKKLIVPFLFGIEKNPIHYSWIFYKYMDFALKNDYPIIADEAYFVNPSVYEEQNEYSFKDIKNNYNYKYEFAKPTDENMQKLKKVPITIKEKTEIYKTCKNNDENVELLSKRNKKFEKMILDKLEQVEKNYGRIEVIMTWIWFPSLEYCCNQKNIKILFLEQTTFRPGNYKYTLGYFQFYDKYNGKILDENYHKFLSKFKNSKNYFNRKELLAIFLNKDKLHIINELDKSIEYEFGINIGPSYNPLEVANLNINDDKLYNQLNGLCSNNEIYASIHPFNKTVNIEELGYQKSYDKSSLEWISKCRRIVSVGSNVAFESMLLGRTSYNIGDKFPYQEGSIHNLDFIEDKVADLKYLNYIIFGYYVSYELMFNKEYIKWRLTESDPYKIYEYNLKYFLQEKLHLDQNIFLEDSLNRVDILLNQNHHTTLKEIQKISNENNNHFNDEQYRKNIITNKSSQKNKIIKKITIHLKKAGVKNEKK